MIIILLTILFIILLILILLQRKDGFDIISTNINTDNYKTNINIYKPAKNNIKEIMFLLHGTPLDQTCVNPLVYEFMKTKNNLCVVTYDLKGHGTAYNNQLPFVENTQDANDVYTKNIYDDFFLVKEKVYDLLKLDKYKKYHLCGWSFGGICSQGIAIANPQMVKTLNIISSVGKGRIAAKPILDNLIQYRENLLKNADVNNTYIGIPPAITSSNLDKWFDVDFINSDIYLNTQKVVQGSSITNYINTYSTIVNFDLSTLWKNESYPVFIFSAPDDPVGSPQLGQDIYDYITNARNEQNKKNVILFKAKDGKHAKCIEEPSIVVSNINL